MLNKNFAKNADFFLTCSLISLIWLFWKCSLNSQSGQSTTSCHFPYSLGEDANKNKFFWGVIVFLLIVQAWRNLACVNPDPHHITRTSMELIQSPPPQNTFYVINTQVPFSFTDSINRSSWIGLTQKGFFGLWISSMKILVILVRIRIIKSPIA